ncbi:hypothetical protein OAK91_03990 [Planctomycetaceae bacterium]|nr:hypothetical protein [Planctomycetaceae bacterium]
MTFPATRRIFGAIFFLTLWPCLDAGVRAEEPLKFHPSSLAEIVLFVESINGMEVTTSDSPDIYNLNTELVPLEKCWSDQKRFPQGTIRWWFDQSGYQRPGQQLKRKPYNPHKTGRDFGQDDHDRPGFIPDGCNGKPCARGGSIPTGTNNDPSAKHGTQPCYFEIQYGQGYKKDTPFSIFLLAKPIHQKNNFVYFGVAHWANLIQSVSDRSLIFKSGPKSISQVSTTNAITYNQWQLIEVHRDATDKVTAVVNGKDVTKGNPILAGELYVGYLMNNNKGQSIPEPMAGDVAAFLVTAQMLDESQRNAVRNYFDSVYKYMPEN